MSVRIRQSVEVAASAEACWRAFSRRADWPRWFPTLSRVQCDVADGTDLRLDDRLVLRLGFRGHDSNVGVKVEEVAHHRVRWAGRTFGVTGDHAFFVEALGDRARFSTDETFTGFPLRLVPKAIFAELEDEARRGLERFRALVEGA